MHAAAGGHLTKRNWSGSGFCITSKSLVKACRGLSEEFRRLHPDDVWADAAGFRNIVVHHYFGIDDEAVWSVVERDLPALKLRVNQALARRLIG